LTEFGGRYGGYAAGKGMELKEENKEGRAEKGRVPIRLAQNVANAVNI